MTKFFKVKVRNVGTSLGILIPKEIADGEKVKIGEEIEVGIFRRNVKGIIKLFGTAKNASRFDRNHVERDF